jgi:uncharacterized protein (TIGR00290 family)
VPRTLLCWSGGKDCAWALHLLRAAGVEVAALFSTVNRSTGRLAMHDVRSELAEAQAASLGLPWWTAPLPWPCPNEEYEAAMTAACRRAVDAGVEDIAFGDLFLRDVREYRERSLAGTGLAAVFPAWGLETAALAREMIDAGVRARVVSVDTSALPAAFAGREFDAAFLDDLPPAVDPCGENGEFHSFVYDGPMFRVPVPFAAGEVRVDGRFAFADLWPASSR